VLDRIRRRWKLLSVAGVIVVLLAVCVGKYWPSDDGPTYMRAGDDLCANLPFEVFEPALGPMLADPEPGTPERGNGKGCQVRFDNAPDIMMTAMVLFFDSPGEAEEAYYAMRSAVTERDAWDLQTTAKRARWSLGRFEARGTALDGNLVVLVSFQLAGTFGSIDVHFGEPMANFLRAAINDVRRASEVSV
jgi:hypothetical protein